MQNLSKLCHSTECKDRGVYLPLENFHSNSSRPDGKSHVCKNCRKMKSSGDKEKLRAKVYDHYRSQKRADRRFQKVYGINMEKYEEMLCDQNETCAICKIHVSQIKARAGVARLFVDHCHSTGKVRGLLCVRCNTGIGMFKDNQVNLVNAMKYLLKNN